MAGDIGTRVERAGDDQKAATRAQLFRLRYREARTVKDSMTQTPFLLRSQVFVD